MRRGMARAKFLAMAAVTALFMGLLLVAPLLLPFDVNDTSLQDSLKAPGEAGFLCGADALGRDVLARTVAGGSESVALGFAVLAVVLVAGVAVGLVAGFCGGAVDALLSKVVTAFQAFPAFVLAVAVAGVLGQGVANMVIAISAVYWTQYARLVRSIVLALKGSECVEAAQVCGASRRALLGRYLLPEVAGPVAILSAVSMSDIILTMAGLSFIGLGPARPTNEWGAMMAEAQSSFQFAPWCMIVPMIALFVAVIVFNLLGDTLRDALDVRTQYAPKRLGRRLGPKGENSDAATAVVGRNTDELAEA